MRELRITDAELAGLIAPRLRARLLKAGFQPGEPTDGHIAYYLPINLDLAGNIEVARSDDGIWVFTQQIGGTLAERTDATMEAHGEAIMAASKQFWRG